MNRMITLLIFFIIALATYLVISYSMEYPKLTPIKEMHVDEDKGVTP